MIRSAIALALSLLYTSSAFGLYTDIQLVSGSVSAESKFEVAVRVGDLDVGTATPPGQVVTFFNLGVGYDASVLRPLSVEFSEALGPLTPTCDDDPLGCLADPLSDLSFDANEEGAFQGYGDYDGLYNDGVLISNASLSLNQWADLSGGQTIQPFTLATIEFETLPNDLMRGSNLVVELMDDTFWTITPDPAYFDLKGVNDDVLTPIDLRNGTLRVPLPAPLTLMSVLLPLMFWTYRSARGERSLSQRR